MAAMLGAIAHRGPDDEGVWNEGDVWLGHRRLSIIDLSAAGHEPMVSACGRYVMVLNGEIYNYGELRAELERSGSKAWRGHSDAEVFLEAVASFGVQAALSHARGMFAFAIWDRQRRTAWLARDRYGEKPLAYAARPGALIFASELSALERAPGVDLSLSRPALGLYFRYGYVPAPLSIYEGASKLPPGCLLTWSPAAGAAVSPYWTLAATVAASRTQRLTDPAAAVDELDGLLRCAVGEQMMSDVPLGAFLSGGVDSSTVAAIMQKVAAGPVKTFTIGFDDPHFDESQHAAAVASHLKTEHTEHTVTAADAQAVVPRLGAIFDEPFADPSQIPTFLISQMARRHVTVCLTGDGGDEMFGGYVRYDGVPRLWNALGRLPLRGVAAAMLEAAPLGLLDSAMGFLGPLARRYAADGPVGPSLRRAAPWLAARSLEDLYELTMTAWPDPESLILDPGLPAAPFRGEKPCFDDAVEAMLWRDAMDYLPGDILTKVDRASMAHGLETRVPLLDPRIAALAWRAPASMKLRGGQTKWLLRQVLYRYVPREMVERPKMGFSVPLHAWLTGELRPWAESLLDPILIRGQGILDGGAVARVWRRYLAGDSSQNHKVWTLLMFQAWQAARGR
jgi:asparagine synthase (glutamine-hydrolysing)